MMRRDLTFFINGVPDQLTVQDAHYFFAPVQEDIKAEIAKLGEGLSYWLNKSGGKFHAFGIRNDFENETEAMMDAYDILTPWN